MKDILLVGPKHSGKTSAGKALASLCSGGFIDLDELAAQQTGKSPRTLYIEGPAVFRKAEAKALAALGAAPLAAPLAADAESGADTIRVIAAGGGIVDNPEAIALLEKTGRALPVYLSVSADTAWERISRAGELPPFLQTGNPRQTHRALHERRGAAYRKLAPIVIEAEGKNPETIAGEIWDKVKNCPDFF
jgi:shikimate kinase